MSEHNPDPSPEPKAKNADDSTLGGYINLHSRPPAFEGTDGHPYTVSIEIEHTGNLRTPYSGYLVFPRWAESGVGIVGHVETPTLAEARTGPQATEILQLLTLQDVKYQLEKAIIRQQELRREND